MFNNYDSEALIKCYRMLAKKCEALDRFIQNHAFHFGVTDCEFGSFDVCNNIIDLMTRKNRLINLKVIVDKAIDVLSENDKKVIFIKMHYNLSMAEICEILELKERTAFRRIEKAIENLTASLNNSKYSEKLDYIMRDEEWIERIRDEIKAKRMALKFRHQ
ncbi:MAG: hypothetical protein E7374_03725 [Clostridiales bacterium]|nr:hypothetical protein [Clostridiales bacterium]